MSNIVVGISDLNIGKGSDVLVTYALGSCVGICIFDPMTKVGGLSHIMLPSSTLNNPGAVNPMRFADTAIVMLIRKLEAAGALRVRMKAKIAGGAQMFSAIGNSSLANIGARNVEAVKKVLAQERIPIIAEDTGKNYGRTVHFSPGDGIMHIVSANKGKWDW
jgi:chemotaxis protein CheD